MLSIGDERSEIISSLTEELQKNDIVIVTGGLGPTKDDITKAALAELSGTDRYKVAGFEEPLDGWYEVPCGASLH